MGIFLVVGNIANLHYCLRKNFIPLLPIFSCYILVKEMSCFEPEGVLLESSRVLMSGVLELTLERLSSTLRNKQICVLMSLER